MILILNDTQEKGFSYILYTIYNMSKYVFFLLYNLYSYVRKVIVFKKKNLKIIKRIIFANEDYTKN